MKTKLLAMMLLAGGSMFAQSRFSIGIGVGGFGAGNYRPVPPSYAANVPPCPGPDYTWVDGYWSQDYGGNRWVAGYWDRRQDRDDYRYEQRGFDNRFNEDHDRQSFRRDFDQYRNGGVSLDRSRSFDQNQNRGFGQNQNQNQNRSFNHSQDQDVNQGRANGQDNRQGRAFSNGFRGR